MNSNRSQTFQYDVLGRVTQAVGFYGTDTMTYDGVGNVLTRSRTATSSVTYSYNRNSNQLSKAVQGGSTYNYTYDADGNMLTRALGRTTQLVIAYNADARPKTAATETFAYDGFGERSIIAVSGGGTHDIFGLGHELLAENNAAGQAQRSYIYLNGRPLAVVDSLGNISYVLAGQLGQPLRMVDGLGNVIWDVALDEFGQLVSQPIGQTSANALRFPGQIDDAVTGLYYNYFRDYEPALGRYVQPDPIGLRGGINPYRYAKGNPVAYSDRLGLFDPAPLTQAARAALLEEGAGGGPEDPLADVAAALTLATGLAEAVLSPDPSPAPQTGGGGGSVNNPPPATTCGDCPPDNPGGRKFAPNKSAQKWASKMRQRGWTPEQIEDAVTGLYYNYFRDYEPALGRYDGTWIGSVTVGPGYIGGVSAYPTVTPAAGGMPLQ